MADVPGYFGGAAVTFSLMFNSNIITVPSFGAVFISSVTLVREGASIMPNCFEILLKKIKS